MSSTGTLRRVGLMGVGAMGIEIGARIVQRGGLLYGFDADAERLAMAAEHGIPTVSSADGLADCDAVICLLPNSEVVDRVVAAPGGLLDLLKPGAVIVDMGSSDPRRTVALSEAAAAKDISLVDAPVSGGVRRARVGELTLMFGGNEDVLNRCRPLLELVATRVVHMGSVGSGHAMKALNNLISAAGLTIACEAIEVGRRCGLDPQVMLETLNASTGSNNATQTKVGQFVLTETYESGFSLRLMLKDVALAVQLADDCGVTDGLAGACREVWQAAAAQLPPDADQTEIARMWSKPASGSLAETGRADQPLGQITPRGT